jgi:hypothetical protein
MSESVTCVFCGRSVARHESFIVRIDVFADPTLPPIDGNESDPIATSETMAALLDQMKHMSADELQDGVHRRFEHRLCAACQRDFLANPLGLPRRAPEHGSHPISGN